MATRLPVMVRSTGSYVPERVVGNDHFATYLDTSDEWIFTRTGIRERRYAAEGEATAHMATHACRRAMDAAEVTIEDIDLIVCCTATPDKPVPSAASLVQEALGAKNTPAMDVSAACAGFLYGTAVVAGLIGGGVYNRALVIGAETLTRMTDMQDRTTCVLFGDAAGAAVLERNDSPERGVLYCELGCDGTRSDLITVPAGGSLRPAAHDTVDQALHAIQMKGREVYKFAVSKMQELIVRALEETGLAASDLKLIIPHQSNLRIIESVRERLQLTPDKIAVNIDKYGNTSAASVPVALDEAVRDGTIRSGDHVALMALGAGLTWGVMIIRL